MIAVVDYKKGNLKSVERGLIAAGADARIMDDATKIARADAIVLPGVGAFADAAATMNELGQMQVIRDRVRAGVPFLGICLGLHLMYSDGVEGAPAGNPAGGLGLLPGVVERMPREDSRGHAYKIPHVGWNSIDLTDAGAASPLFQGIESGAYFYFTHSYIAPRGATELALTQHSVIFPSAVSFGDRAFGVQFHPEKSSDAGALVLRNFARLAEQIR